MAFAPISGRLALLVGGGPAPGLNGVISSVTIEAVEQGVEVIGFQDGFKWLVKGDATHFRKLMIEDVKGIYSRGGSVLGTSRTNPAKSDEHMRNVLETFRKLNVTMLVTIGGDDTAYSGSQVYQRAAGAVRVAHVPKTIDNDLPLPGSAPTFGYETARHLGVGIVRNLAEDARTTSRWYLIVSMGRAAGHLALGIGKAAAATLTIIPEEFRGRPVSIDEVCDILVGSIVKRRSANLNYGVAVLAEGLIEAIGEKGLATMLNDEQLGRYGNISRDDHGHLRLGDIDFGRMMKDRAQPETQGGSVSKSPLSTRNLVTNFAAPIRFLSMRNTRATWDTGRCSSFSPTSRPNAAPSSAWKAAISGRCRSRRCSIRKHGA